jgi:DNA recombination-dependent growth factor C
MTGLIAVIMIFSIPIVAILTDFALKQKKMKQKALETELELEKLKHDNYVIETQKLRLELEQMKLEDAKKQHNQLIE